MGKYALPPQRGFFPQPVYLIGTYKDDGSPNFALITWVTFCSVEPPMLMFASRGKKLTRELVEKNKMFSANLVKTEMMPMTDYFGITSGYNHNKCEAVQAEAFPGSSLNVPILKASPWVYECALVDVIAEGNGFIYVGEVKNIMVDDTIADTGYGKIDMVQLDPLIYAPGQYYNLSKGIGTVGFTKK
jgi:flavin reductase (DIM6/NTAB) family NADH-FMN oxidoreductase RutF